MVFFLGGKYASALAGTESDSGLKANPPRRRRRGRWSNFQRVRQRQNTRHNPLCAPLCRFAVALQRPLYLTTICRCCCRRRRCWLTHLGIYIYTRRHSNMQLHLMFFLLYIFFFCIFVYVKQRTETEAASVRLLRPAKVSPPPFGQT